MTRGRWTFGFGIPALVTEVAEAGKVVYGKQKRFSELPLSKRTLAGLRAQKAALVPAPRLAPSSSRGFPELRPAGYERARLGEVLHELKRRRRCARFSTTFPTT